VRYAHEPGQSAGRLPLAPPPPPPLQPPRGGLDAITVLAGPPIAAGSKPHAARLGGQRAEGNRSAHVLLLLRASGLRQGGRPGRGVFTKRGMILARKAMLNRRILIRIPNTYPERNLFSSLRSASYASASVTGSSKYVFPG
jgi:hypothetical protein